MKQLTLTVIVTEEREQQVAEMLAQAAAYLIGERLAEDTVVKRSALGAES